MIAPLSTYSYSDNVTLEEEKEQSNARIDALRKIADYIDVPSNNNLGEIIDEFLKQDDIKNYDSNMITKRYNFFKNAFQVALEEQKKAELKAKLICLLYKQVDCFFDTYSDLEKNFPNETEKTVEKAIKYGYYAIDITSSGRSVEDIFKLPLDKICEIANCERPEHWEEIEQFVFNKKVGIQYLKRIIQIINDDNSINLEVAFEQAKNEAKAKREDINSGSALERRYKKLKKIYKWSEESCNKAWTAHKESEKLRRKFQHRSEKWSKLNTELNEQIKAIKKVLRKKFPDINEIKNIVGIADKNSTEQETKNNIITEIINKVEYYPMVIDDSTPITS